MKLIIALKIANDCALTDVGEAIYNIRIHAGNLFTYGEEQNEFDELMHEFKVAGVTHGVSFNTSIKDALEKLEV